MEIIDRLIKPEVQAGFRQDPCLDHTLKEMPKGNQRAGDDFHIVHPDITAFLKHNDGILFEWNETSGGCVFAVGSIISHQTAWDKRNFRSRRSGNP